MTETVREVGLYVLALVAVVGVFVVYITKGTVPDFAVLLASTLVGAVAGVSIPATRAAVVPGVTPAADPAPYVGGNG